MIYQMMCHGSFENTCEVTQSYTSFIWTKRHFCKYTFMIYGAEWHAHILKDGQWIAVAVGAV